MEMVGHEAITDELDFSSVVFEFMRRRNLRGLSSKAGSGEIELEVGEESGVIFLVFEDETFVDTAIVEVVVATRLVFFEGIFTRHKLNISHTFEDCPRRLGEGEPGVGEVDRGGGIEEEGKAGEGEIDEIGLATF